MKEEIGKDTSHENLKPELSIDIERPFEEQPRIDASYFEKPFIEMVLDLWRKNEHLREYVSEIEEYLQKQMLEDALYKAYDISWDIHNKLYPHNPRAFVAAVDKVMLMELAIEELMSEIKKIAPSFNMDKGDTNNPKL